MAPPGMEYFEFKVTLCDDRLFPWRQFQLSSVATFHDLHIAIQLACGWQDRHLYKFGDADPSSPIAEIAHPERSADTQDSRTYPLSEHFCSGREWCSYLYDYGDDWCHEVDLIGRPTLPERFARRLIAGERAFPPENCGGIDGYERLVALRATGEDPWGEDASELLEWLGDWQPDRFDLAATKRSFDATSFA